MKAKISPLTLLKPFDIKAKNNALYVAALTHSSYAHENGNNNHYERLEFMGDAVLQVVSAEFLYNLYPDKPEGTLTKIRSKLVRTESLAKLGRELGIPDMMYLGNGEEKDRGKKDALIEDCVEAFIGALYIDQGFETARKVVTSYLNTLLLELSNDDIVDYKSELQELIQSDSRELLKYELISCEGKDNNKTFYYRVVHDGVVLGKGSGKSKKAAEQEAAKQALAKLAK